MYHVHFLILLVLEQCLVNGKKVVMMGRTSCFYGSIPSCGYFCPVAEATAELHAIKFVVATAATGGRGNPVPDGEHQSEMVIQLSPTFNFWGECEKRSQSNPIKYPASQKRVILL